MLVRLLSLAVVILGFAASTPFVFAGDTIPKVAWKRGIGQPLENPGGRKPALAQSGMIDDGYWQGAPVGGFGSGTFSRTYRGDFARWHIKAGVHKYQTVWANQFAVYEKAEDGEPVAQVLTAGHPDDGELNSWKWDYPVGAGDYYALYPKSWYDYRYERFPAHVMLEQFSPVLPNNYRESSYPVAVYRWHVENPTDKQVTVSILLSWTNMLGWFRDFQHDMKGALNTGNHNKFMDESAVGGHVKGIVFDRVHPKGVQDDWDGQWAIASVQSAGVDITYQTTFEPGNGADVWQAFSKDGRLANNNQEWISSGEPLAGAIAVRFILRPGEKRTVPMTIAWDMPVVQFGSGRSWYRHYTNFYGTGGNNAWKIAKDGLQNSVKWSNEIDAWQAPYVKDESKPEWYRSELFNELYILTDGGSFWGKPVGPTPPPKPVKSTEQSTDSFAFMECYDYPFYGTLDVRFYGSMPLIKFWPDLDKLELKTFADTVPQDLTQKYLWIWKSQHSPSLQFRVRKAKGAVPHDLGVPEEDPFKLPNAFSWQNTNDWKDLNSKFVLMVYRDYVFTGRKDVAFLRSTWPAVKQALEHLRQYDRTGDGLPQGDNYPDQTYDEWIVQGDSAYSGGLWLASLRAAEEIAHVLNDNASATKYKDWFAKGQKTYIDKLWTGEYFRYDTDSEYRDNVQADQLAGQWYANMTGLGDIVPHDMQVKALKKIFDLNVMKFENGEMGAVNGIAADGTLITSNEQVQEVWTGTTFGAAALMLSDGLKDEGFKTAWGVYHTNWEKEGYWFRTPEAWDKTGHYRASMYMRPAAIWAMEMTSPPK
ncbi:MAG TPA: non-lysosomal glucosylceramidase [Terriglobales bacterium]|nr:non-lysosomal glucosylceramidase [Terriglobales bacterium]